MVYGRGDGVYAVGQYGCASTAFTPWGSRWGLPFLCHSRKWVRDAVILRVSVRHAGILGVSQGLSQPEG